MNFNVNKEVLEKNPGITLDAAMILIDQKKMAVLYSNEVENFSSQDSNMTGETINTQDLEEMTKIVGTILETNTEPEVELDDSVLTGAEEYAAEYVNAEKVELGE